MPAIQFGLSSYERGRGDLPELPVINMFAEEAPTEKAGVVLQSRPELEDRTADMGNGPVDCLFQRDLVLDSALFGISGATLYKGTTEIGTVNGGGPFSMAGYETFLFTAGGANLWGYDGTALAAITMPDGQNVIKTFVGASRVMAIPEATGQFFYSDPLETDIDALDFATAESQADRLLDGLFIDDTAVLFGAETIEFWPNTNDPDLPFAPLEGRVIERGIWGTGCATAFGKTFAWVTNVNEEDGSGGQVCVGDEDNVISTSGLEARIGQSDTCRLFRFYLEGAEMLALRLDDETQVFNRRSALWSEFASYGEDNWLPQCFAGGVFGSAVDGKTLRWGDGHEDMGGQLERRFRGGFPLDSGGVRIDNVQLRCNVGQTPFLTGDYDDPVVEMRTSRDAGKTWGDWRPAGLGEQGQYRTKVQWRSCGTFSQPGFLAEFRVTDPIDWRVSSALLNEPYGGR